MEIKLQIGIDDRIITGLKRVLRPRTGLMLLVVLGVATSALVYAATITKPNTFSDGTTISAAQVNANFDTLYTEENAKESRVTALEKFEGFSYYGTGSSHAAGWNPITNISTLDYNTFGTSTYNGSTSTFTAPKAGYYRFISHGYIATQGLSDERIAIGIYRNGGLRAFAGGAFSAADTPGPQFAHVVYLNTNDSIALYAFTAIACTMGSTSVGHYWWFQGEYLGK